MAMSVASTGNVNDPAEESFSCCCLAVSSLDRKRNLVVVHSVAKSVPVVLSDAAGSYLIHGSNKGKTKSKTPNSSLKSPRESPPGPHFKAL